MIRAVAARAALWASLATGGACELDSSAVPLTDGADARQDEVAVELETTTITDAAELKGVERVRGHLVIAGAGLVRLSDLVVIDGDLRVLGSEANPRAADVQLPKLARVGGTVEIGAVDGRFSAPSLATVGGHLWVHDGALTLELSELAAVGGDVRMQAAATGPLVMPSLTHLGGSLRWSASADSALTLAALESVDGDVSLHGDIAFDAPRLLAIGGDLVAEDGAARLTLEALRQVGGDLRLENVALATLDIADLRAVGDDLVIEASGPLETFAPDALATVGGDLRLARVRDLRVVSMSALTTVGGALVVEGAPDLEEVTATVLGAVGGDVVVRDGAVLKLVLSGLEAIGGDLVASGNASFQGILPLLASIGGDLDLGEGGFEYTGLGALTAIGGDVRLSHLTGTPEYDELRLESLRTIGGGLVLEDTRALEKLALVALLSIGAGSATGGDLVVRDNTALSGLLLPELGAVSGAIIVTDNPALPTDATLAELADVVSGATTTVCDNLGGEPCAAP